MAKRKKDRDTTDVYIRYIDSDVFEWMDEIIYEYQYSSRGAFISDLLRYIKEKDPDFERSFLSDSEAS